MDIFQILLTTTYTHADILRRLDFVREFFESIYFHETKQAESPVLNGLEVFLKSKHIPEEELADMLAYGPDFYSVFTAQSLYSMLKELQERADHLPTVPLYLPTDVGPAEVRRLGKWFRKNVSGQLLLVIHIDPASAGGCALVWNGRYLDLSLRFSSPEKNRKFLDGFS